jgi:hypothetical protein
MFGSSKLGLIRDSGKATVAARRRLDVPPRPRSSCTIVAIPFSKPTAVDGYQGFISLDRGFAIFNCRLPIADFQLDYLL